MRATSGWTWLQRRRRASDERPTVRVDLRVLVVDDGDLAVRAIIGALHAMGVPFTRVGLRRLRRRIRPRMLARGNRAYFQAVILPNHRPDGLSRAEMAALQAFERAFAVRQVDVNDFPGPTVGLEPPLYSGPLDGTTATVTNVGRAAGFSYLRGPVPFDADSYGHLAVPRPQAAGESFETLVAAVPPGGGPTTSLVGVHTHGGREELVITATQDDEQLHTQLLAQGIVMWATRGVHLGFSRNYLSVQIDDVFAENDRWEGGGQTGSGDAPPPIRMVPDDVVYLRDWQARHGFVFDLAYNGGWSEVFVTAQGSDPLAETFVAHRADFRWVNHTFTHAFLGCERDLGPTPWRCELDERGEVRWVSREIIVEEIARNLAWARARGIEVDAGALVTGEHSGLRSLPQQPDDNPFLGSALAELGVTHLASDSSREREPRTAGGVGTVPRYPMGIFFNAATKAEEVEEYEVLKPSAAALDPATGFEEHIVPLETAETLRHVLGNDPRPHYAHQSNLTEERILLPLLEATLSRYRATVDPSAPLLQPTFREAGDILWRQLTWSRQRGSVTAFLRDGRIEVRSSGPVTVPLTVPEGSVVPGTGAPFGEAYGGARSAWVPVASGATTVAQLSGDALRPTPEGGPKRPFQVVLSGLLSRRNPG